MDAELRRCKQTIRSFVRRHYSDQDLHSALAHARDGKLSYASCCCLIGIPTADHALRGEEEGDRDTPHYITAAKLPGAAEAEHAFLALWHRPAEDVPNALDTVGSDGVRRRRIIPILLAEIRRRERLRASASSGDAGRTEESAVSSLT